MELLAKEVMPQIADLTGDAAAVAAAAR
jgi:hypothetical protein